MDKKTFLAIKTNDGIFISDASDQVSTDGLIKNYLFNGKVAEKTFHKSWVKINEIPQRIEIKQEPLSTNYRYELIDKRVQSDIVPNTLKRDEVSYYNAEEYTWMWKKEYGHLQSLYKLVNDLVPQPNKNIEFEIKTIVDLNGHKIDNTGMIQYKANRTNIWDYNRNITITDEAVGHQLIDKIVYPDILFPLLPCSLTSEQVYDIVRNHIQDNIDPKFAVITSDYDFCFTVEKKIELIEPEQFTVDLNAFSYRKKKPKYEKHVKKHKTVKIFSMTNAKDSYKGYCVISGIRAENHAKLKEKLDNYLADLISYINRPVKQCEHCSGEGHCYEKTFKLNSMNQ